MAYANPWQPNFDQVTLAPLGRGRGPRNRRGNKQVAAEAVCVAPVANSLQIAKRKSNSDGMWSQSQGYQTLVFNSLKT